MVSSPYLLFLGTENSVDRCATDGTGTPQGRFPVFRRDPLGIFHIGLLFTLDAIVLVGHSFYSLLILEKTYTPHNGANSTRQVHFVSLSLHLLLHVNGSA